MSTNNTPINLRPGSFGHLNRRMFYDNTRLSAPALNYIQYQHEVNMELLVHPYTRGVLSGLEQVETSPEAGNDSGMSSGDAISISPGAAVLQDPETGTKTFFPVKDPLSVDTSDLGDRVGQQLLLTYTQEERGSIASLDVSVTHSEYDERIPKLVWWDKTETTRPENPFCVLYELAEEPENPDASDVSEDANNTTSFVFKTSSEYRQTAFCNTFPVGTVIPFAGDDWHDDNTIPGWFVCNGQNGTPDLSARFLMGKDADNSAGSTGGSNSIEQGVLLADHKHKNAGSTTSGGRHKHDISLRYRGHQLWPDGSEKDVLVGVGRYTLPWSRHIGSAQTGDTQYGGSHSHKLNTSTEGGSVVQGSIQGEKVDIRPAFYSVRYIMRRS